MRIRYWSSDVCSSDLRCAGQVELRHPFTGSDAGHSIERKVLNKIIQKGITMDARKLFNLEGKTALITGGTRGIGFMIAQGLVQVGVKTYVTSRKAETCEEAEAELRKIGEAYAIPADVADADQRSEEHTSELQSLMRISYAVFCLKKKTKKTNAIVIHQLTATDRKYNIHQYIHTQN